MKKRILTGLMAALLAASFASCGNNSTSTSASTESSKASESTSATEEASAEESSSDSDPAAEAIAARTEPAHLVVNWFTFTGAPAGLDRIEEKMNELTIPALNIEAKLQVTDYGSRSQQLTLQISGGEQLDIVQSLGVGYTNGIANDYWEDLEQEVDGLPLLQTYGQGIIETMGDTYINAARFSDGVLYGIPQQKEQAGGRFSIAVRTDCLKNAESAMDLVPNYEGEYWQIDNGLDDLVTIIKALHDTNPGMDAFDPQSGYLCWTKVDSMGDYFGVLGNWGTGDIVDFFREESYLDMVHAMRELYEYGCINPSAITDTTASSAKIIAGTTCSFISQYKPGSRIQENASCQNDMTFVYGGPNFTASNSVASMPWCITVNNSDLVAAMQYLNFMYTSSDWNTLFNWGEEGVDYTVEDGTAKVGSEAEYQHSVQWICPGQFKAYPAYGNPTNLWDLYEDFNENAIVSEASGFIFDKTPVVNEYTAVSNVYSEYQKSIEFGAVDPDSAIDEMEAKLASAGYQKILDEKQRQYDEWKAANGK